MRMKQIHAKTMQEAMNLARTELGEDAVLLRQDKKAGEIVLTFGIEDMPSALDEVAPPQQFHTRHTPPANTNTRTDHATLTLLSQCFTWHGLSQHISKSLLTTAEAYAQNKRGSLSDAEHLLAETLGAVLRFSPIESIPPARPLMLVGTPGAGKTFAIAKLVADAVKRKARLRVVTTDNSRAAAYDQLAAFTQIMGVPLEMADTPEALARTLTNAQGHELLIDTAGCNPYHFDELKQLGELAKQRLIEPMLVLPLGIDASEAQEIASVFSFLDIERLFISRTDCARRFGGVLAAMEAGDYALSNISDSLKVADGCPALTPFKLAQLLLRPIRERTS